MKVLDAVLEAYSDRSDQFKKYINRAYKFVTTRRAKEDTELIVKSRHNSNYRVPANEPLSVSRSYKVTITLHNGLSYSVKRKDPEEAKWICWYKLIESLAIAEHWFTYRYNMDLNNYYLLTYMKDGKPVNYARRIGFHKPKFVNKYKETNPKPGTQPRLFW